MSIQLHKCAHFVFCIKNIQNFVDLDACKQLFVLNSYKTVIKKPEAQKNHKSMIFFSDLNHDLNQDLNHDLNQTTLNAAL